MRRAYIYKLTLLGLLSIYMLTAAGAGMMGVGHLLSPTVSTEDSSGAVITTESGSFLTTESGDPLRTE